MSPALVPATEPDLNSKLFEVTAPEHSLWDLPPAFGGTWRDFFKIFEDKENGLTRTEIFNTAPDPEGLLGSCFQYVLTQAISAGILISREIDDSQIVDRGSALAVKASYPERLYLNAESSKLQQLFLEGLTQNNQAVEAFKLFDFVSLARGLELDLIGDYGSRFIDFLKEKPINKSHTLTDFYKSPELYPNPESSFLWPVRDFIDKVLTQAVSSGVLESLTEKDGREVYHLSIKI
jgi:hypothetical protein